MVNLDDLAGLGCICFVFTSGYLLSVPTSNAGKTANDQPGSCKVIRSGQRFEIVDI
jgi:hypothetical protein